MKIPDFLINDKIDYPVLKIERESFPDDEEITRRSRLKSPHSRRIRQPSLPHSSMVV